MAKPDLSTERPGGAQAQPGQRAQTRHVASAGGQAAKLKDMQATLQNTLRHHPVVLEQQAQRAQDVQLRIADWITAFAGSMNFVYLHIALFTVWMLFIESKPWPTLTLIVSLEAIFLSTFVMIGQNLLDAQRGLALAGVQRHPGGCAPDAAQLDVGWRPRS